MAALPEWKQQLLERKRKEEEEGRRREMELQERLSKMPTWKREIIQRRRAKLGSGASFSEPGEGGGVFPQHGSMDGMSPTRGGPEEDERIGPVHQNPFIKLEKQRKESTEGDPGTKARAMSDLYSQMPGVRTIRAENIIIIESDPRFFQVDDHREDAKSKSVEALNSMMAVGNPREIHANEVLIIKSSMSRSVEDLNTINRTQEDSSTPGRPRKGQVSQLLSRFGQEKSGWSRAARSLSTENLADKGSKESCNDDTPSPEPQAMPRWEANGQHKPNFKERTSPTSPTTPNTSTSGPLPPSPSRSLLPQHKVTPFHSQLKSKSLEVPSPEPPCRSPGSLSPLMPKPWQKDLLRAVEVVEEPRINMALASTPRDVAMPAGEGSPLEGRPNLGTSMHGVLCEDSLHNGTEEEVGQLPEGSDQGLAKTEPSWRSHFVDPKHQHKEGEAASPPKRTYEGDNTWERTAMCPESRSPGPPSPLPAATMPNLQHAVGASTSLNDSFEVRASPAPDLSLIAEDDLQGLALANLRLQSRNSFVIVPRRRPSPPPDLRPSPSPAQEASTLPAPKPWAQSPAEALPSDPQPGPRPEGAPEPPSMSRLYNLKAPVPRARPDDGRPTPFSLRKPGGCFYQPERPGARPVAPEAAQGPQPGAVGATDEGPQGGEEGPPARRGGPLQGAEEGPPARRGGPLQGAEEGTLARRGGPLQGSAPPHHAVHRKSGNTITINPRKAPPGAAILENGGPAVAVETDAATRTEGVRKKRYPTAEEIQVIGGYLALERSCLAKSDPQRRKMELSFSESDLERIFEYPSEESVLEEFGPPEEPEPQAPSTQNDDDEEEEVPQNGLAGSGSVGHIMRTKPLIVDESCRR